LVAYLYSGGLASKFEGYVQEWKKALNYLDILDFDFVIGAHASYSLGVFFNWPPISSN
jgi:hypothetical protein